VLATGVGLGFVRVLYAGEDISDRIWNGRPEWLRPAVGGVLLGLLLLAVPEMYGVGYPVLALAVAGHYLILALLGLLAAKILATSLTTWIGGSGGVFAPSLFMGAMLGSAYGAVAHDIVPGVAVAAGAYGLVGMGAVFASSARAPTTHTCRTEQRMTRQPGASLPSQRSDNQALAPVTARRNQAHERTEGPARR
jgi:chloride channel protein, CIC family